MDVRIVVATGNATYYLFLRIPPHQDVFLSCFTFFTGHEILLSLESLWHLMSFSCCHLGTFVLLVMV